MYDKSEFKCKICNRGFASKQALGGHKSRSHTGASDKYNRQMLVRESRILERITLGAAKELYGHYFGESTPYNRHMLKKIKTGLLKRASFNNIEDLMDQYE